MSNIQGDLCDVCGDPITPANVGQCTAEDVICSDCLRFAVEKAEGVVNHPPFDLGGEA